jgi:hypothetical protein
MFFHAAGERGAFKYFSFKACHKAEQVSLMILLTVDLPMR